MAYEECMKCGKEYKLYSKGSISAEIYHGMVKTFADHSHLELCPSCNKPLLIFLKEHLGKNAWIVSRKISKK